MCRRWRSPSRTTTTTSKHHESVVFLHYLLYTLATRLTHQFCPRCARCFARSPAPSRNVVHSLNWLKNFRSPAELAPASYFCPRRALRRRKIPSSTRNFLCSNGTFQSDSQAPMFKLWFGIMKSPPGCSGSHRLTSRTMPSITHNTPPASFRATISSHSNSRNLDAAYPELGFAKIAELATPETFRGVAQRLHDSYLVIRWRFSHCGALKKRALDRTHPCPRQRVTARRSLRSSVLAEAPCRLAAPRQSKRCKSEEDVGGREIPRRRACARE